VPCYQKHGVRTGSSEHTADKETDSWLGTLIVACGVLIVHGQSRLFRERLGDFVFIAGKKQNMSALGQPS
jgi:hypothetical protein